MMTDTIDHTILDGYREMDAEFFSSLIGDFLAEASRRIISLRDALDHGDVRALSAEAHGLKGSAAVFGAAAVTEMCQVLENRENAGHEAETLHCLELELDRVCAALEEARRAQPEGAR